LVLLAFFFSLDASRLEDAVLGSVDVLADALGLRNAAYTSYVPAQYLLGVAQDGASEDVEIDWVIPVGAGVD
jgi:hypothetical protein